MARFAGLALLVLALAACGGDSEPAAEPEPEPAATSDAATTEPAEEEPHGSARNRLAAEVTSVTEIGARVRVGLASPQPLAAEVTGESVSELGLRPGARVAAVWKATATRLMPR